MSCIVTSRKIALHYPPNLTLAALCKVRAMTPRRIVPLLLHLTATSGVLDADNKKPGFRRVGITGRSVPPADPRLRSVPVHRQCQPTSPWSEPLGVAMWCACAARGSSRAILLRACAFHAPKRTRALSLPGGLLCQLRYSFAVRGGGL